MTTTTTTTTTDRVPDTQRNADMTQRILVVEDEVALASGIRDALAHAGFEAEVVHDGAGALEAFKRTRFDLIVLDLMLPGKSGLEVLKELRGLRHEVRVVVLTALSDESDVVRGFEMGADDYMAKP
jgi:two-component system response regulator MtrA